MNDNELHTLLRQTRPKPVFLTSFQREVWARIAIAEQQSWEVQWQQWFQVLFLWIARPVPAAVILTTMLVAGAGLGNLTAPDGNVSARRSAYIASINPLIATHTETHE
ncbi:MAG: hypothetical protein WAW39_24945 [Prosthecobacter sp.]|uniref:hypothetical protein n=1 Tax=Prosthecobacter sp. TaxID=1965333 RepID=UPI003BAF9563